MSDSIRLFLAGDVMTGRGIDQILPSPSSPELYESYVTDARRYVDLAEAASGRIRSPVAYSYIWGDALSVLQRLSPDVRIVNLETSVTSSDAYWRGKGINYRMHPDNTPCLTAASIDCCTLANNHVLDWGYPGLEETLSVLQAAGLRPTGAGRDDTEARAPAVIDLGPGGRVLVFAFGAASSGIPPDWAAGSGQAGVSLMPDRASAAEALIAGTIASYRRPGDLVVVSLHWGGNWGYAVPANQRELARALVERAGVDIVHGHSSHHAKGIEIIGGRPVIYGCGDFINDYEGISGHAQYRGDLRLAYCVSMRADGGGMESLDVIPFRAHRLSLKLASDADVAWVEAMLGRESGEFGVAAHRWRADTVRVGADTPQRTAG